MSKLSVFFCFILQVQILTGSYLFSRYYDHNSKIIEDMEAKIEYLSSDLSDEIKVLREQLGSHVVSVNNNLDLYDHRIIEMTNSLEETTQKLTEEAAAYYIEAFSKSTNQIEVPKIKTKEIQIVDDNGQVWGLWRHQADQNYTVLLQIADPSKNKGVGIKTEIEQSSISLNDNIILTSNDEASFVTIRGINPQGKIGISGMTMTSDASKAALFSIDASQHMRFVSGYNDWQSVSMLSNSSGIPLYAYAADYNGYLQSFQHKNPRQRTADTLGDLSTMKFILDIFRGRL